MTRSQATRSNSASTRSCLAKSIEVRHSAVASNGLPPSSRPRRALRSLGAVGDRGEAKAEADAHLLLPLAQQRTRRTNDQDPMRPAPHQQFGRDQSGLDGLSQADAVGQQQPRPHHVQRTQQRDALIRLDRHPARRRPAHRASVPAAGRCDSVARPPGSRHPRRAVRCAERDSVRPDTARPIPGRPDRRRSRPNARAAGRRDALPRSHPIPDRGRRP